MCRVLPRVHEDDRHGVDAGRPRLFERRPDRVDVGNRLDDAVRADALLHLHDALVELFRQDDFLGEDVWPCLVGDAQRVAEALGDQEQHAVALALQKRVGGHGRAHLDVADLRRGNRLAGGNAKQVADALYRSVAVGLGVLRQKLAGVNGAVGIAADDVGERTAAVNPEVPFSARHRVSPHIVFQDIC